MTQGLIDHGGLWSWHPVGDVVGCFEQDFPFKAFDVAGLFAMLEAVELTVGGSLSVLTHTVGDVRLEYVVKVVDSIGDLFG
jgi:hypothetical protein